MAAPRKSAQQVAAREKAQRIIAQGKADAETARKESGRVISQMIETGESKTAVAARLGISSATLKKYLPAPVSAGTVSEPAGV